LPPAAEAETAAARHKGSANRRGHERCDIVESPGEFMIRFVAMQK